MTQELPGNRMLRRLLLGLVEGLVIGLALGVGSARGLGLSAPGGVVLALLGAGAGFLVGLVAGRPVWARDAKTEALLKASVGALVGAGLSFAAAHWLKVPLDLSAFQLGVGPAGMLASATLPLVATVLALLFELDDDGAGRANARTGSARSKRRLAPGGGSTERDELKELAELGDRDESNDESERKLGKR
ncbi:MAG TPA: hypothetical protein VGF76_13365 [Polyangiaceae bacterium]